MLRVLFVVVLFLAIVGGGWLLISWICVETGLPRIAAVLAEIALILGCLYYLIYYHKWPGSPGAAI